MRSEVNGPVWVMFLSLAMAAIAGPAQAGPIHDAAKYGDLDTVKQLLEKDPELLEAEAARDGTPLFYAIMGGNKKIVELLLASGADMRVTVDGTTPLMKAAAWGQKDVAAALLDHGADIDAADWREETALHYAVRRGQRTTAEFLLKKGANVNAKDEKGQTPLLIAAYVKKIDLIPLLLEHGADANIKESEGFVPLHWFAEEDRSKYREVITLLLKHSAESVDRDFFLAVAFGQVEKAKKLLDADPALLSTTDPSGAPLTFYAAHGGHKEMLELLLARGAELEVDPEHNPPELTLLSTATEAGSVDVIKFLLSKGVDVDERIEYSETPLIKAAWLEKREAVKCLLDNGADPTAVDKFGSTALHYAVRKGQVDIAQVLLERGAKINLPDKDGRTPLRLAVWKGYEEAIGLLLKHGASLDIFTATALGKKKQVLSMLNEDPALLQARDRYKNTLLHWAALGNEEMVELLLEKGLATDSENTGNEQPLHIATTRRKADVAKVLLAHGADPNAGDMSGDTPLHEAAWRGDLTIAKLLLANGAAVDARNDTRQTPLHYGLRGGRAELSELLLSHGADIYAKDKHDITPFDQAGRNEETSALIFRKTGRRPPPLPINWRTDMFISF